MVGAKVWRRRGDALGEEGSKQEGEALGEEGPKQEGAVCMSILSSAKSAPGPKKSDPVSSQLYTRRILAAAADATASWRE